MPAGRREEDGATRIESVAAEAVARVRRTRISVSVIAMSLTLWIRNDASDGPDEVRFRLLTEKTGSGFEITTMTWPPSTEIVGGSTETSAGFSMYSMETPSRRVCTSVELKLVHCRPSAASPFTRAGGVTNSTRALAIPREPSDRVKLIIEVIIDACTETHRAGSLKQRSSTPAPTRIVTPLGNPAGGKEMRSATLTPPESGEENARALPVVVIADARFSVDAPRVNDTGNFATPMVPSANTGPTAFSVPRGLSTHIMTLDSGSWVAGAMTDTTAVLSVPGATSTLLIFTVAIVSLALKGDTKRKVRSVNGSISVSTFSSTTERRVPPACAAAGGKTPVASIAAGFLYSNMKHVSTGPS
mmetsp:Transcript_35808/g.84719  ORF Transcript_35808/g.84719 Transcript_35808/m.84719 type:complete len:359 (-) Transcript_35808:27-1103(-)